MPNDARCRCLWSLAFGIPVLAAAVVMVGIPGCGDGRPERVPVSGRVLIDGKPLTYGFIRLEPKSDRPATGEIRADGRFTLTTFEDGDGAVLGTHPVMVLAAEPLSSTRQKWHAPPKYANSRLSGLTATVTGPTDQLEINLSWEGGKPYIETVSKSE